MKRVTYSEIGETRGAAARAAGHLLHVRKKDLFFLHQVRAQLICQLGEGDLQPLQFRMVLAVHTSHLGEQSLETGDLALHVRVVTC